MCEILTLKNLADIQFPKNLWQSSSDTFFRFFISTLSMFLKEARLTSYFVNPQVGLTIYTVCIAPILQSVMLEIYKPNIHSVSPLIQYFPQFTAVRHSTRVRHVNNDNNVDLIRYSPTEVLNVTVIITRFLVSIVWWILCLIVFLLQAL